MRQPATTSHPGDIPKLSGSATDVLLGDGTFGSVPGAAGTVPTSRTITAGIGLAGGGDLSANRTIDLDVNDLTAEGTVEVADTVPIYDASEGATNKATIANIATAIATSLNVTSNVYTPTITGVANVTGSVATECQYMRVGSVVTVSGMVDVTMTLAATATSFGVSLPVASNFADFHNCGGVFSNGDVVGEVGAVAADTANDRASFFLISVSTGSQVFFFTFTYKII